MITIELCEDENLGSKITKYINNNLKVMVEVYIDYLNVDDGFDLSEKLIEVLPRDYVIRKPDECRKLVDELYEIIISSVTREYIKPKYEYLLYQIMYRWKDICDDDNDYIPIKLDDQLMGEISTCEEFIDEESGSNFMVSELEDFERFLNACFYDFDFLPDQLSIMIKLYLNTSDIFKSRFLDVELDDYVDLMPVDLRDLYLEKTKNKLPRNDSEEWNFKRLFDTIINSCIQLQGNIMYKKATENERNTFISSLLEMAGYYTKDQTLWGESYHGKTSGE